MLAGIEPGIVELEKNPLRPLEIVRVGGVNLAAPIVAEAEGFYLPLEDGDVGFGGLARMLAGADGVLLGGQAEGVPAHRVQDVVAEGAAVAGQDVGGGVAFRMADVQAGAGRIGEHVQDIKLGRQAGRRQRRRAGVPLGKGMLRRESAPPGSRRERWLARPKNAAIWVRSNERDTAGAWCGAFISCFRAIEQAEDPRKIQQPRPGS